MNNGIQERRRKFYGWGYEGDEVWSQEIAEFEKALAGLLGVTDFMAMPFSIRACCSTRHDKAQR